jgi:hypothetical protein
MIEYAFASQQLGEFAGCAEWERLLRQFIAATGDLIALQAQASEADLPGNPSFDRILQRAVIEKLRTKWALLRHLQHHRRCGVPEWVAAGATATSYCV